MAALKAPREGSDEGDEAAGTPLCCCFCCCCSWLTRPLLLAEDEESSGGAVVALVLEGKFKNLLSAACCLKIPGLLTRI